ncbi:hypothetical protein QFC19_001843 [Naganishia cerealis]|uniref:Uncharacterized protein n=1 Tax=Naganishia cerealis TaxID=610337 RepID=A0ACC2WF78_9TREE|nr:hypothetical protein QFC19_001843 [Naganishia cerealis]
MTSNAPTVASATKGVSLAVTDVPNVTNRANASTSAAVDNIKMSYVNRTTKKGNMSLVKPEIYGKFEKARLNKPVKPAREKAIQLAGKRSQPGRGSYTSQLSSANGGTSIAKRVVIDGVTYEFEEDGVTLKRVEDASSAKHKKRKLDNRDGAQADGDDCLYPHVKVADDSPVCVAFSTEGWCDKGSTCQERHAWECREYSEKGVCSRGTKCGLAHVLKAKTPAAVVDVSDDDSSIPGAGTPGTNQQPDDVEPPRNGIPPMPEKTIEHEQQVAQDQVLHNSEGISMGNDFERQEDFIQFADMDVDEDEEDETEDDASDEAMSSGVDEEGDQRIKYSFGESSEEISEDNGEDLKS